jgi:putative oxidoreductase
MAKNQRLEVSLLALRLGVFLVMLVWTIDKFVRPEHTAKVFENFYFMQDLSYRIIYFIGIVQLIFILGFLIGFMKRFTYGIVLLLHGISTFSSFKQYLAPYEGSNIMFFAAWPMLAACLSLFLMRKEDNLMAIEKGEV